MGERDYLYVLQCDRAEDDERERRAAAERALYHRYRQVQAMYADNEFLDVALADYRRYFEHIRGEKERQYEAMRELHHYIERMRGEMSVADHLLREAVTDQAALLREISEVRRQIDHEIPRPVSTPSDHEHDADGADADADAEDDQAEGERPPRTH